MRHIDMNSWPRRKHFELYITFDYPHFNLCANVNITNFYASLKQRPESINNGIIYLLARCANEIPEFRYRIRGNQVVEHEIVHPSAIVLTDDNSFSYCTMPYQVDFSRFAARAQELAQQVKENPVLEDEPGQDDLLFMTTVPWVSFTSIAHPIHMNPVDSVPRIAWGKFFNQGEQLKMPLSIQAHHALMDGFHAGQYYQLVQQYLSDPDTLLGPYGVY